MGFGAAALDVGGLLQALIAATRPLRAARSRLRSEARALVIGGIAVVVYPLAFYSSMHLAGVAIGTVVSLASAPIVSGLLNIFIDRTPPEKRWFVASGLGVTGGLFLCLSDSPARTHPPPPASGSP